MRKALSVPQYQQNSKLNFKHVEELLNLGAIV